MQCFQFWCPCANDIGNKIHAIKGNENEREVQRWKLTNPPKRYALDDTLSFAHNESWWNVPVYLEGQPKVVKIDEDNDVTGTYDTNIENYVQYLRGFVIPARIIDFENKPFTTTIMKVGTSLANTGIEMNLFTKFCHDWLRTSFIHDIYFPDFKFENLVYIIGETNQWEIRFIDLNDIITIKTVFDSAMQEATESKTRGVISTFLNSVNWQKNHLIKKHTLHGFNIKNDASILQFRLTPDNLKNFVSIHQFHSIMMMYIKAADKMKWPEESVLQFFENCISNAHYGVSFIKRPSLSEGSPYEMTMKLMIYD